MKMTEYSSDSLFTNLLLEEIQDLFAEEAAEDSEVKKDIGRYSEYEAEIVERLISRGVEIPNLRDFPGRDSGDSVLMRLIKSYEYIPRIHRSISKDYLKGRAAILNVVAGMASSLFQVRQGSDPEYESIISEDKAELQLKIIDDSYIPSEDKEALLDVFDQFVPVDGLDLTDDESIEIMRARFKEQRIIDDYSFEARSFIGPVIDAFKKVYGENDNFFKLASLMEFYISRRRRSADLEQFNGLDPGLMGAFRIRLLGIGAMIGIPEEVLLTVMNDISETI